MSAFRDQDGRTIEVDCTIDLEQTTESLHAYVELDGIEAGPGDEVLVHYAPTSIAFGESLVCRRRATLRRATWKDRVLARIRGYLELFELFEVGFSARSAS
jgi:hypothetical protein